MTVLVVPEGTFLQGPATDTEANKRHHTVASLRRHFAGILRQPGLAGFGDCVVTATGTPDGHVHVSSGAVWVKGTSATLQGNYMVYNDADQDINVLGPNPAHATLPRVDAVVAQVTDFFYTGSDGEFIQMVTGTPGASPALPTLPATSYALAYLLIPAASATITTTNIANIAVPAVRDSTPAKLYEDLLGSATATLAYPKQLPSPAPAMTLPTYFRHLFIDWYARGDNATSDVQLRLRVNNDSGSTYDFERHHSSGAATSVVESLTQTAIDIAWIPGASATANYFGTGEARIKHYTGAVGNKPVYSDYAWFRTNATGDQFRGMNSGKWRTTATPITRLDLLLSAGNLVTGSLITVRGEF